MALGSLFVVLILGSFGVAAQRGYEVEIYKEIDANSSEVKELMLFVAETKEEETNKQLREVKVTLAEKQELDDGANYKLTFQARICDTENVCLPPEDETPVHCVAVVHVPLTGERTLTSIRCHVP
ncbi:uncharacterized protein LOC135375943 [Ornithodoros turicata]|uniref:uncharacterized protein LOC135375943 n=1 Tax=Ornithodoros turicata TaxID=34597 RepID=UPI00313969F0